MNDMQSNPWLHRFAVSTVCVALITLVAGALVTSRNAGMAFRDWPTSDGRNMFAYPWLSDFARDGDKFLEHGHRLAGVLIGVWSITLAWLVVRYESRPWLKVAAVCVLLGVILQGLLGGFRVWFDERGLAMLHGIFAACVFSLMACVATALGRSWQQAPERFREVRMSAVKWLALASVGLLALQYVLGSLIRHRGTGLHEHLGIGLLVLVLVVANTIAAYRSGVGWLRRSAAMLMTAVLVQIALGGAAWVTKFGFGTTGYVAVADSIPQVISRTAHTIVGIVVFMAGVVHALRVMRVDYMSRRRQEPIRRPARAASTTSLTAAGGAG